MKSERLSRLHWTGVWDLPDPHYPCRKIKYHSKQEAKKAIKQLRAAMPGWERKGKALAYKCNNCGLWHWGPSQGAAR